jgi:hypothetical protein
MIENPEPEMPATPAAADAPTSKPAPKAVVKGKVKVAGKGAEKKKHVERPYPKTSLERAVALARAIKSHNAGNPMEAAQVAKAIDLAPGSSGFFYAASAAVKFGLVKRENGRIALEPLGSELVYAPSADIENGARRKAFLKCDIFRRFLEFYKGTDLPEMEYVSRVLESQFQLERSLHAEFVQVFKSNCTYLGIKTLADAVGAPSGKNGVLAVAKAKVSTKAADDVETAPETDEVDGPTCFVIMPFGEKGPDKRPAGFFREVYEQLIVPAAKEAGFRVQTARKKGTEVIHSTIVNSVIDADLVLADLTDHNPNVLCELGMRLMANRPIALIRAQGTGPIFDVDNLLRVEDYEATLWASSIKRDIPRLAEHLKATWENRDSQSYLDILRRGATPTVATPLAAAPMVVN